MSAYDRFMGKIEKEFQAAVDEVALEDCMGAVAIVGYGYLWNRTRLGDDTPINPLTVKLVSDYNEWVKAVDLEEQWEDLIADYGSDIDIGEQVRDNAQQLIFDLRRVARKLELQIKEIEGAAE